MPDRHTADTITDDELDRLYRELEQAEVEHGRMRGLLHSENERANSAIERETVLEGEIEAQQAVIERVRAVADRLNDPLQTRGIRNIARSILTALDEPKEPTP